MNSNAVQQHYQVDDLDIVDQVRQFVATRQRPLTAQDLAGLDQFHVGGLDATEELAALLGLRPELRVLDAGSGLGGPARYVAATYGCHVTGVDLTERFVAVSSLLADLTGMGESVDYRVGNLLQMDFPDQHFDVVYTQHVVMNIGERARLYREIRRVLKPGGVFGFYDVLAVDEQTEPHYPVPWAEQAATSFLLTAEQTQAEMLAAGFAVESWKDVSADALAWFKQQRNATTKTSGMEVIMGPRFAAMRENFARNLIERRVRLVMSSSRAI